MSAVEWSLYKTECHSSPKKDRLAPPRPNRDWLRRQHGHALFPFSQDGHIKLNAHAAWQRACASARVQTECTPACTRALLCARMSERERELACENGL
eukprot:6208457-Pleurochrysis_carterae.AAC.3